MYLLCRGKGGQLLTQRESRRYVIIANKRKVKYLVIVCLSGKEFIYILPRVFVVCPNDRTSMAQSPFRVGPVEGP